MSVLGSEGALSEPAALDSDPPDVGSVVESTKTWFPVGDTASVGARVRGTTLIDVTTMVPIAIHTVQAVLIRSR